MTEKKFNPAEHLIQLKSSQGLQDYLKVQHRLVWFRDANPHGHIATELVQLDLEIGLAVFKATITDESGGTATGYGSETVKDFRDFLEKAETKAVGRGLAMLGFGTQFAPELDEQHRIVDSPVERHDAQQTAQQQQVRQVYRLARQR